MPKIEIPVNYLTATIEHLGKLAQRYEAEAAAFASMGEAGHEMAEERLSDAKEVRALQEYFLHQ